MKREVGLFGLTASGVGLILGAGIYALIGRAAGITGNSVWASFILGAFISSFTGLSYAELSCIIPKAAAEYSFVMETFKNELISFLIGWIIIFSEIVSASTVALAFGGYFKGLFGTSAVLNAVMIIILLSIVNYIGIKESSRINIVFTFIEAMGLLIVVIFGVQYFGRVDYLDTPQGLGGLLKAGALIFFAYLGFEDIVNLAEESKNPDRDIPRALILSVVLTALIYVLVAVAAVSLADWQELQNSESPLAYAASKYFGQTAFFIMSVIALFATSNTVLMLLIVGSRMIYGMAKDAQLPNALSKISRRGTPWLAILAIMIGSSAFALFGNIELVAEITNFGIFIAFASVNMSAIWLRYKKPQLDRPFKTPMAIANVPIIPLIGLLTCGLMVSQLRLDVIALGFLIIFLGLIFKRTLKRAVRDNALSIIPKAS